MSIFTLDWHRECRIACSIGRIKKKANNVKRARKSEKKKAKARKRNRLDPDVRAKQILKGAITFFAEHGFAGQTRELAVGLGISEGLLYRYFPSKEALIDRVYEEVFLHRWNPEWETILTDRSRALIDRLKAFYVDYAKMILEYEWVRIYLLSALAGSSINRKYVKLAEERIYRRVINELRYEFGVSDAEKSAPTEPELEMMWNLHGSIFYIGMRKWVYHVKAPSDVDGAIKRMVDSLYLGAKAVMQQGRLR
jgi:AcrR family transcriptional regulator